MNVQHISAYHLTIEENTRFGRMMAKGEFCEIDECSSVSHFSWVHNALVAGGFEHYEVSNYALKGYRSKHNSSYWQGVEYLGIGAGAHSFSRDNRTWCISTAKEYAEGLFRYEDEQLSADDHLNEYIMVSLRTSRGIELDYIAKHFGQERVAEIEQQLQRWLDSGIMQRKKDKVFILSEHFLISDAVIESLFV
jgi:oxygen-independent coproporphyrinogen-3 oxidase